MGPRVAHLIASSGFYGAERVVVLLSQAMRSAALAEPVVFCLEDSPDSRQEVGQRAVACGIDVEYVRVSNQRLFRSVDTIAEAMSRRSIQIAHSHGYKGLILGHKACRKAGIPIVATNHGWYGSTWRVRLYQQWEGRIMRNLLAVTAVAEANAAQVRAAGVNPHRVEIITNGVLRAQSGQRDDAFRRQHDLSPDALVVGVVSQLIRRKGLDLLLLALAKLRARGMNASLMVAGDGPMRQSLSQQAEALDLTPHVRWLGFCVDTDTVYAACDLITMPSRNEGMPMTILEAMSHGKPVVAANVGGVGEIIRDGVNGRLVPPEDPGRLAEALAELLVDETLRHHLGAAARQTIESQFSVERMAASYADLYHRAMAGPVSVC